MQCHSHCRVLSSVCVFGVFGGEGGGGGRAGEVEEGELYWVG